MDITISGIYLDGYSVPVPHGLTELINTAGAWGTRKSEPVNDRYDRKVEKREGNFVTILSLKKPYKEDK